MQKTLLFFFLVLWAFSLSAQKNGTIFIQANSFRNTKGLMRFAVYKDKATFMDARKYYKNGRTAVTGSKVNATISVPPGRYAVSVLHDENENDNMDFTLGLPKEGFGISNISSFPFGKPPFEKCLITVEEGKNTVVIINMHYTAF